MRSHQFVAACVVAGCPSLTSATMAQATGACCFDPDADRGSGDICLLLTEGDCNSMAPPVADYYGAGSDCTVCFGGGGGACCIDDFVVGCVGVADELACENLRFVTSEGNGVYQGDGTSCIPNPPPFGDCPPPPPPDMPAVSQWGVATLVLLILAGITIKFATIQSRV